MDVPNDSKSPKRQPGPEADTLRIEGDWEDAVKKALRKPPPPGGWPKESKREKGDKAEGDGA